MPHVLQAAIHTACVIGLSVIGISVMAQEKFPSRAIEMIIPTPPGGGTDISFRKLAEIAGATLGQKVVAVNKPGASGAIGMNTVVQAKPDGYIIGALYNAPLTMTPHTSDTLYRPSDYIAITLVTAAPSVLCVRPEFPAKDGKEFVDELRRNPNKYTYGNDGVGGITHVSVERAFLKLGVKARAVPFGGSGETLKAFLGGHVHIYGGTIPPIIAYVKEKTAKCLLLTSAGRNAEVPEAAGLAELGAGSEATDVWRGVIAPKGMSPDRVAVLEKAFSQAAQSPEFRDFMRKRGEEAKGSTAEEFRKVIETEYQAMGDVMVAIGLAKR